jgi:hypothetical protein
MRTLTTFLTSAVTFALILPAAPTKAADESRRDGLETLRSDLKANRTAVIAQQMQLTQQESDGFWPIYRAYRSEVDRANDEIVKLVLDYSDEYPNVSEDRAKEMLDSYLKFEEQLLKLKEKYLKSFGKVLPPTKVFRFAQLDNRLDLGTRVGLAASIPILGSAQAQPGAK